MKLAQKCLELREVSLTVLQLRGGVEASRAEAKSFKTAAKLHALRAAWAPYAPAPATREPPIRGTRMSRECKRKSREYSFSRISSFSSYFFFTPFFFFSWFIFFTNFFFFPFFFALEVFDDVYEFILLSKRQRRVAAFAIGGRDIRAPLDEQFDASEIFVADGQMQRRFLE